MRLLFGMGGHWVNPSLFSTFNLFVQIQTFPLSSHLGVFQLDGHSDLPFYSLISPLRASQSDSTLSKTTCFLLDYPGFRADNQDKGAGRILPLVSYLLSYLFRYPLGTNVVPFGTSF